MQTIHVLLQTTIGRVDNDWHIGRFSMLAEHLASAGTADGAHFEVTARNLDRGADGADQVLAKLDRSAFDQLWLFAVDVGDGLNTTECAGIDAFHQRGGGILSARDHQDLGCSLLALDCVGPAHHFHTKNQDPRQENRCVDDTETKAILWPNYHSGRNGDVQRITPVEPVHPLLENRASPRRVVEFLPAHPHEGSVDVGATCAGARVVATGKSQSTGHSFNLSVAYDPAGPEGRWIAESSFHHFADYNWDTRKGAPSFVTEKPGDQIAKNPKLLDDVRAYTANIGRWLSRHPRGSQAAG